MLFTEVYFGTRDIMFIQSLRLYSEHFRQLKRDFMYEGNGAKPFLYFPHALYFQHRVTFSDVIISQHGFSFIFWTPCDLLWCRDISAWLYFDLKFIFEVSSCPFELSWVSLEMLNSPTHYTKLPTIIFSFFLDFFDRKICRFCTSF